MGAGQPPRPRSPSRAVSRSSELVRRVPPSPPPARGAAAWHGGPEARRWLLPCPRQEASCPASREGQGRVGEPAESREMRDPSAPGARAPNPSGCHARGDGSAEMFVPGHGSRGTGAHVERHGTARHSTTQLWDEQRERRSGRMVMGVNRAAGYSRRGWLGTPGRWARGSVCPGGSAPPAGTVRAICGHRQGRREGERWGCGEWAGRRGSALAEGRWGCPCPGSPSPRGAGTGREEVVADTRPPAPSPGGCHQRPSEPRRSRGAMGPGCAGVLGWLLLVQAASRAAGKSWRHVPAAGVSGLGRHSHGFGVRGGSKG